jgi:hypothetical protein
VPKTSSIAVWSSPGVPPCIDNGFFSRMDGGHGADLSQDYVFESIIPPAKDEPGRVNLCEPGGFDSAAASSLRSRLSPLLPSRPYFCGSLGRLRQHPAENLVVSCLRTSCSAGRHRRGLPCSARAGWATALPGSELDTKRRWIQKRQTGTQAEGGAAEFLDQRYFFCRVGIPRLSASARDRWRLKIPRGTRRFPGLQVDVVTEAVVGRISKNGVGQVAVRFVAKKAIAQEQIPCDPIPGRGEVAGDRKLRGIEQVERSRRSEGYRASLAVRHRGQENDGSAWILFVLEPRCRACGLSAAGWPARWSVPAQGRSGFD